MVQFKGIRAAGEEELISLEHDAMIESARVLGAVSAIGRLGSGLAAHAFQEFEEWLAKKRYLDLGFRNEVEFLNSPRSPITKNRYFDRKKILEKEGAQTFDLLNSLRVPLSIRKLISDGSVKVDDNIIEVGSERVDLNDRARITELVYSLATKTETLERTVEKGRKEIDKHKREKTELRDQLQRGGGVAADSTPHARALVSSIGNLQLLAEEIKAIDDAKEKKRFAKVALEHLGNANKLIEKALGFEPPQSKFNNLSDEDFQELADAEG